MLESPAVRSREKPGLAGLGYTGRQRSCDSGSRSQWNPSQLAFKGCARSASRWPAMWSAAGPLTPVLLKVQSSESIPYPALPGRAWRPYVHSKGRKSLNHGTPARQSTCLHFLPVPPVHPQPPPPQKSGKGSGRRLMRRALPDQLPAALVNQACFIVANNNHGPGTAPPPTEYGHAKCRADPGPAIGRAGPMNDEKLVGNAYCKVEGCESSVGFQVPLANSESLNRNRDTSRCPHCQAGPTEVDPRDRCVSTGPRAGRPCCPTVTVAKLPRRPGRRRRRRSLK